MVILHWLSILIEIIVCYMGINLALKKRPFGWGIALTFGLYVVYDLVKLLSIPVSVNVLYVLFFIASLSALWFTWQLTRALRQGKFY